MYAYINFHSISTYYLARVERFELPSTVLETGILPLHYTRNCGPGRTRTYMLVRGRIYSPLSQPIAQPIHFFAGYLGFEPRTIRLTVECSTAELPGNSRLTRCERGNTDARPVCQAVFQKKCHALVFICGFTISKGLETGRRSAKTSGVSTFAGKTLSSRSGARAPRPGPL